MSWSSEPEQASDPNQWTRRLMPTMHRLLLGRLLNMLNLSNVSVTIVLGAGFDPYSRLFRPFSCSYIRTDVMIHGRSTDVVADGRVLPFRSGSCDRIVGLEVLEHISEPQLVMHEAARVLRPGGTAVFSVPFLFAVHGNEDYDFWRPTPSGVRAWLPDTLVEESIRTYGGFLAVAWDLLTGSGRHWRRVLRVVNGPIGAIAAGDGIRLADSNDHRRVFSGLVVELRRV